MTTDSNMPVLWQNCSSQYSTTYAQRAWLWFAETRGSGMQYAADAYADEVERIARFLGRVDANIAARDLSEPVTLHRIPDNLVRFILRRHANYRLGGNIRPDFLEDAQ